MSVNYVEKVKDFPLWSEKAPKSYVLPRILDNRTRGSYNDIGRDQVH